MTPDTRPEDGFLDLAARRLEQRRSRRSFLKWSGMAAATLTVAAACDDDDDIFNPDDDDDPDAVNLDFSSDFGVLNYAYALEQLEAAFYTFAVANFFGGASTDEQQVLTDLRDHEIAHRELFRAALGANAIPGLSPDFSAVDFGSRQSVLQTAMTFEDLGVAAYNGAGKYVSNADYLTVAGKIVSVEARHASVIRTLLGNSFAPNAFDPAMAPADVLSAAAPFIQNTITTSNT